MPSVAVTVVQITASKYYEKFTCPCQQRGIVIISTERGIVTIPNGHKR